MVEEKRDIFSILEDGQPFKAEQRTLRRDRKGIKAEKKIVVRRIKKEENQKQEESDTIAPETNFVSE